MLKIRLSRQGSRNNPFYRIIAIDKQKKVRGASLDTLGYWHPKKESYKIDMKKLKYWKEKGASVSEAVVKLAK